jgi:flavodoxin
MKKALIVYQSKKGHTKKYGEEIGNFLNEKGIESVVISIDEFKNESLHDVSCLLLGCWTSGLFLMFQHPDKPWNQFAKKISLPAGIKIGLFTTYKLATGSMFRAMIKQIPSQPDNISLLLKSKTGLLSGADKSSLAIFIAE